jgi:hydroxyacylglutathione hydrolase
MLLKYFYDKKLAQASYLVGCSATGEALVVDPARDIQQYLDAAEAEGLNITHVTETHIHADYVSGGRELAEATGAKLYLSDMGDENWKYGYRTANTILVTDGDAWRVGNVKVEVLHTPGHTPESVSFMVTDTAATDKPLGVFTGDFLFVGDVGRPDLLEEAAGMVGTSEPGARQQFKSVEKFKQLPDHLQIWPAHGAGSACGKALGAIPSTTLGYEKLVNPAFQFNHDQEDEFVAWLLEGQPEAPYYFARMKHVNKVGPELLKDVPQPKHMSRAELDQALAEGALVVDLRDRADYAQAYIPGTINIPENSGGCVNYLGWFVDYNEPLYIIAEADKVEPILNNFKAIGADNVAGYATPEIVIGETEQLPLMSAVDVAQQLQQNGAFVVDVRGASEYESQHIAGAKHIPLGYLLKHLNELPKDVTIVTQCATGYRSQIAASLLRKNGFANVATLNDPQTVWSQTVPVEEA